MDQYKCGDCRKEFDSFENFLIHKLLYEQYKLCIEPSKQIPGLRLPKFVKITSGSDFEEKGQKTARATVEITESHIPTVSCNNSKDQVEQTNEQDNVQSDSLPNNTHALDIATSIDIDSDDDDDASIWSQAESLKIDESVTAKSSPLPEAHSEPLLKKKNLYCKHCDRHYKNKVVLRVHQETVHSSHRPFCCKFCKQAFKTKGSLIRHERTHTGERPYWCQVCSQAFHESGSLSRHILHVHNRCPWQKKSTQKMQVFVARLQQT